MKTVHSLYLKPLATLLLLAFTTLGFGQTGSVSVCKVAQTFQNVTEIEVDGLFASVNVVGSERTDVDFAAELFAKKESHDVTIKRTLNDGKLKISVENDNWPKMGSFSGQLTLQVPKNIHLTIGSISGNVIIKNVSNLTTKSKFTSISGEVKLDSIKGEFSVSAISGSINLSKIEGILHASSISGSITGTGIMLTDNSEFKSISGFIDVALLNPEEVLSFDLSSVSGSTTVKEIKTKHGLEIKKGAILIKGSTISGSQMYR